MAFAREKLGEGTAARSLSLLGFAILLSAMAFIAMSALYACGFSWMGWIVDNCSDRALALPASRDDALAREEADTERLEKELAQLRTLLASVRQCSAPRPPPRAEAPAPAAPTAGIPDVAWKKQEVKHLSGCWRLSSDYKLRDIHTSEVYPVASWTMCFDERGNGSHEMALGNGTNCNAEVKAQFKGESRLEINEENDIRCVSGQIIFKRQIVCERSASGGVRCESSQEGSQSRSTVSFERRSG